ncbi:MAG: hypothetical protein HRU82_02635 [Nitrospira sp.]|nr:MAG: hypothetical protein HRU82_02635 [Nitrospira sp.]
MTPIRATFIGMQYSRFGQFPLYTLLEPLGDEHPIHSTVSLNTIHVHGRTPVEAVQDSETEKEACK